MKYRATSIFYPGKHFDVIADNQDEAWGEAVLHFDEYKGTEVKDFYTAVGEVAEREYGLAGGRDLCLSLVEDGVIDNNGSIADAAREVAARL